MAPFLDGDDALRAFLASHEPPAAMTSTKTVPTTGRPPRCRAPIPSHFPSRPCVPQVLPQYTFHPLAVGLRQRLARARFLPSPALQTQK